jgi:hypothetical protein
MLGIVIDAFRPPLLLAIRSCSTLMKAVNEAGADCHYQKV